MAKEYDCKCNSCNASWSFNDADLAEIKKRQGQIKKDMAMGIVGAVSGSTVNPTWQTNRLLDASEGAVDYGRCPRCGSVDVTITETEVENLFLDDASSALYIPGTVSSEEVPASAKSKVVAGVLSILLGALGIHKFYLGYIKEGAITLALTFVGGFITFGLAAAAMCVVGWIEGIIYLSKDKGDFYSTYELGHKGWF